ncbi:CinA family protein [Roseovarius sp. EL26]|uniref:CinA family protein n=1 Tax=Roseovarius sp. EL26 TaxID=2126672 RepID=UPI000EA1B3E3|nr:CinA family protein [Roseovarius sp. EL26]
MSIAHQIIDSAINNRIKITTAESCTGGLVSADITDVPGSSRVFERGYVTYSNAAKSDLLGVLQTTLDTYGAVSEQVAAEMANGALLDAAADIAISITGIAGPGGSEHKPEGRVCFALAISGTPTQTVTIEFGAAGRTVVRQQARDHALSWLQMELAKITR